MTFEHADVGHDEVEHRFELVRSRVASFGQGGCGLQQIAILEVVIVVVLGPELRWHGHEATPLLVVPRPTIIPRRRTGEDVLQLFTEFVDHRWRGGEVGGASKIDLRGQTTDGLRTEVGPGRNRRLLVSREVHRDRTVDLVGQLRNAEQHTRQRGVPLDARRGHHRHVAARRGERADRLRLVGRLVRQERNHTGFTDPGQSLCHRPWLTTPGGKRAGDRMPTGDPGQRVPRRRRLVWPCHQTNGVTSSYFGSQTDAVAVPCGLLRQHDRPARTVRCGNAYFVFGPPCRGDGLAFRRRYGGPVRQLKRESAPTHLHPGSGTALGHGDLSR